MSSGIAGWELFRDGVGAASEGRLNRRVAYGPARPVLIRCPADCIAVQFSELRNLVGAWYRLGGASLRRCNNEDSQMSFLEFGRRGPVHSPDEPTHLHRLPADLSFECRVPVRLWAGLLGYSCGQGGHVGGRYRRPPPPHGWSVLCFVGVTPTACARQIGGIHQPSRACSQLRLTRLSVSRETILFLWAYTSSQFALMFARSCRSLGQRAFHVKHGATPTTDRVAVGYATFIWYSPSSA
ncbi:hypothetical protein QFZ35_000768 [Arthrobacter ulcerisalmonis]|nr:hypothetical protein [Arthrobacter ulcerisalmonis]